MVAVAAAQSHAPFLGRGACAERHFWGASKWGLAPHAEQHVTICSVGKSTNSFPTNSPAKILPILDNIKLYRMMGFEE